VTSPDARRRGWWADKVRQTVAHVRASVAPGDREALARWCSPDQLALFDAMHVADQRHGLDVVARLRADGVIDAEVLLAGLLHDCAKGDAGVLPRIAYALGGRYGRWIWRVAGAVPGWAPALERLRVHPEASAVLAARAGCSRRTVELIRHQDAPVDPVMGRLLKLADEAS